MKIHIMLLSTTALLLVGCATTGNWDDDSLFFNPNQGNERLAAMQAELHFVKGQAVSLSGQTTKLESELKSARQEHRTGQRELASLQNDISQLERQADALRFRLNGITTANAEMAEVRADLQSQIERLEVRIAKLRSDLLLLLKHR